MSLPGRQANDSSFFQQVHTGLMRAWKLNRPPKTSKPPGTIE